MGTFCGIRLKHWQRLSAEFYGTFLLVLTTTVALPLAPPGGAPLSRGFAFVVLCYTLFPISLGMLNPAITLALLIRKKLTKFEAFSTILVQMLAAIWAGIFGFLVVGSKEWDNVGYPHVAHPILRGNAFWGELIQTFGIVTVYLNTTATRNFEGKHFFGLATGFTQMAGAIVLEKTTGACFNPATAMLTMIHGRGGDLPVYLFGPFLGGILAAIVFEVTHPGESEHDSWVHRWLGLTNKPDADMRTQDISKYTMEFLGTFFLVWIVALHLNATDETNSVIAIGAILMSFVYAGGHVSGAHYNPCVTLAVFLRGKQTTPPLISLEQAFRYIGVQIFAAWFASCMAVIANNGWDNITAPSAGAGDTQLLAFIIELIFSTMLISAVLSSATLDKHKTSGNGYFGQAIGWVILSCAMSVGSVSGGVFNPAIGIALPIVTGKNLGSIILYMAAEFFASFIAVWQFNFWTKVDPDDPDIDEPSIEKPGLEMIDTNENPLRANGRDSPEAEDKKIIGNNMNSSV